MNKRQKKKLYKQEIGKNPPKKMKYSGKSYHRAINKPWGGKKTTVNCSWDCEKLKEIATQQEFAEGKNAGSGSSHPQPAPETDPDGFMNIPEGIEEEMPF